MWPHLDGDDHEEDFKALIVCRGVTLVRVVALC